MEGHQGPGEKKYTQILKFGTKQHGCIRQVVVKQGRSEVTVFFVSVCVIPAVGRSADSARALSSAVGSNRDHPFCRTACAAVWTVERTPLLLASATTLCFRLVIRDPPGTSPRRRPLSPCEIAAYNWNDRQISNLNQVIDRFCEIIFYYIWSPTQIYHCTDEPSLNLVGS